MANLGLFGVAVLGLAGCLLGTRTASGNGGLSVSITGLSAGASLRYGGPPIRFTVTSVSLGVTTS